MATTLYNYINMAENDFDTYDIEYDAEVTVCHIYKENDEYDKFCNGIIKKVDVIKINGDSLIVNWSELINRNMDKFREFSEEHWYANCQYEDDDDEFIYQWINEIHQYMAGNVSEDFYSVLNKFVDSLE
jgi:hypothetical protein